MKGHGEQPRLGIVWQSQSHPEEGPGEAVGKGAASFTVETLGYQRYQDYGITANDNDDMELASLSL